jgi:hypothetical protein
MDGVITKAPLGGKMFCGLKGRDWNRKRRECFFITVLSPLCYHTRFTRLWQLND